MFKISGQGVVTGPSIITSKMDWPSSGVDNPVFTNDDVTSWNVEMSNNKNNSSNSRVSGRLTFFFRFYLSFN